MRFSCSLCVFRVPTGIINLFAFHIREIYVKQLPISVHGAESSSKNLYSFSRSTTFPRLCALSTKRPQLDPILKQFTPLHPIYLSSILILLSCHLDIGFPSYLLHKILCGLIRYISSVKMSDVLKQQIQSPTSEIRDFTVVKIQVGVFCIVAPCNVVVRY
jgi:hypothetical protein